MHANFSFSMIFVTFTFSMLRLLRAKSIFLLQIFSSLSFSVFLLFQKDILQIQFSFFFFLRFSSEKKYFSKYFLSFPSLTFVSSQNIFFFSKYFPPFPTLFCFSSAKQIISFYKYYPTFPSPLICQIICSFSFSGI